ncbi:MAG: DUF1549 domain-containing protein, partial [Planctomycetaceae bacterium]|nr:DUF1549 domain-containing protein [Planctomycetaceae bacterium]
MDAASPSIIRLLLADIRLLLAGLIVSAVCPGPLAADDKSHEQHELHFVREVLPVLRTRCIACHGGDPDDVRGNFGLLNREQLVRGGDSGSPAVLLDAPDESPLLLSIQRNSDDWSAMPPKENDQLSETQINAIRQWIHDGAVWPADDVIAAIEARQRPLAQGMVQLAISGGLTADWNHRTYRAEDLWAWQPLRSSADTLQKVMRQTANIRTDDTIPTDNTGGPDTFIDAILDQSGIQPAAAAERYALLRRATFDLLGLPPTPAEMDDFVNDPAPLEQAFAVVVERLLASPHYGEHWGQHWLDVVRYADSSGFANDYERGNAWRYRDYVVRSFNADKPYDQWILEQIAGDEIAELRQNQSLLEAHRFLQTPDDELIIAAGFLRMGPWELTGMEVEKIARQRFLDDVTDSVGQVFLGHLLQCARCHDHKFDPVPTRDYYAIQAAFATTQLTEREAGFLPNENTAGFDERRYLLQRRKYYEQILTELDRQSTAAARQWLVEQDFPTTEFDQVIAEFPADHPDYDQIRSRLRKRGIDESQIPPRHAGFEPRDFGMERVARKGIERLAWRLDRYEPRAHSVYSGPTPVLHRVNAPLAMPANRHNTGELEATAILAGGDPFSPTDPVSPGVLSSVTLTAFPGTPAQGHPATESVTSESAERPPLVGRRLELARWIASPGNPLTPRVMANRIWQWHFG